MMRADLSLAENYVYHSRPPLDVPITVLAGRDDDVSDAQVTGWQHETSGAFAVRWFAGGHFFIDSAGPEVVAAVNTTLAPLVAALDLHG